MHPIFVHSLLFIPIPVSLLIMPLQHFGIITHCVSLIIIEGLTFVKLCLFSSAVLGFHNL